MSCHALRVWERRYGFPRPERTASGHRRYAREQVQILVHVASRVQQGESVAELFAAIHEGRFAPGPEATEPAGPDADDGVVELIDRLMAGDLDAGEACYQQLARNYETPELIVRVIEPALVQAGERWFRNECHVFHERVVSRFLRRKLDVLIEEAEQANRQPTHTLLAGTVQGDRHSGGVLMLHLFLVMSGWRVLNMGVDLPVSEYEKAVADWRPDALGLSFVLSRNINKRFQELTRIRGLPIFVGGRSILNYQSLARRHGLIPVPGPVTTAVARLRGEFDEWRRRRAGRAGLS